MAGDWAWKPVPFQVRDARTRDALFIAPIVIDACNPNRLLGGSLSLRETTAAQALNTPTSGPGWRAIKGSTGSRISAIAVSPDEGPASVSAGELLWAGQTLACATHGRGLYRIDPSGV